MMPNSDLRDRLKIPIHHSYYVRKDLQILSVVNKGEMSLVMRKPAFAYAKLISGFVFATQLVQFLYFLNQKFQSSSHLL